MSFGFTKNFRYLTGETPHFWRLYESAAMNGDVSVALH
jgi:hypothetical protein